VVGVLRVQAICDTDGVVRRPDRGVFDSRRAALMEFKFCDEEEGYRWQLRRSARLYRQLGYEVAGAYIWYVPDDRVVKA
jgi:hypothetical protein